MAASAIAGLRPSHSRPAGAALPRHRNRRPDGARQVLRSGLQFPRATGVAAEPAVFARCLRRPSPTIAAAAARSFISFDDGMKSDYRAAFPLLVEYGFAAAFFVNTAEVGKPGVPRLARDARDAAGRHVVPVAWASSCGLFATGRADRDRTAPPFARDAGAETRTAR